MSESRAFRKCHVCDQICEHDGEVRRCDGCGRTFAPFYYYDDKATPIFGTSDYRVTTTASAEAWPPIRGLTAYWSAE